MWLHISEPAANIIGGVTKTRTRTNQRKAALTQQSRQATYGSNPISRIKSFSGPLTQPLFRRGVLVKRAAPNVAMSVNLLDDLVATPWRHGFIALMRRINADPAIAPVGTALLPYAEPFRIGQKPSLVFAPSEVAEARIKDNRLHIRLHSLGMLGPNGPLPIHVTEIAREREALRGDTTLSNFLDVFHHRSLALLYRAWASAQAAASLDRPDHDRFSFYVGCVSGTSPRRDRTVRLPSHARLASGVHLVHEARNPDALAMTVAHRFGVPARIDEWSLHWTVLPPKLQCRAGEERMSAILGGGAVLGEQVPGKMHRFCLVLGPLDIETYHRLTPRGADLLRLVALVRAHMGLEYEWLLELQIRPQDATCASLGDHQQLGWSGWLGESPAGEPVVGMRFEPELYVKQLVRNMKQVQR
ncbi:type VI secretion protein, VC_A0111 family [Burkholderia sp. Ch1-1]|uniref:Type VI secretion protein, VC_A0111 family n=2 Tax=Burkholderiaceae TaxID=119060 RepID=A0A5Q4ZJJ4_9BURK|nr:type VI secretion protein, VC_A0111 family [Burkholderia sp. Ch1-1]VVD31787.1 Type VI secretion protein, VC_A0111 family [Paraburkholderia dioscoreae]